MYKLDDLKLRRQTWVESSQVPKKYIGWELSDCIDVDPTILEVIQQWVDSVKSGEIIDVIGERNAGVGLALYGEGGQGKTTIVSAIVQDLIRTAPLDVFPFNTTQPVFFTTYVDLVNLRGYLMGDYVEGSKEALWEGIMGKAKQESRNIRLLVIDDIGKEFRSASGWQASILDEVIRSRYTNCLPTIITSNIPTQKWDEYNSAMASFAKEAFVNIPVKSPIGDLRGQR
jgi:DNA replication protein DnaC